MSECASFGFLGPTAPPFNESMEILNFLFYWTGALCWTITLFFLFLWTIGRFSIERVEIKESNDREDR